MFAITRSSWDRSRHAIPAWLKWDGKLVRSCGLKVAPGMDVVTESKRAADARAEAFDVILGNHMLYWHRLR